MKYKSTCECHLPSTCCSFTVSCVWSYARHRAQYGVTTSHSTCCGCCVRDYHICFRLFALSSSSVSTLCLKDPRSPPPPGWYNSAGSSDSLVIWVARLSSNSKNRENLLLTNNKNAFYWNTFVRQLIISKQCLLSWQKEESISKEEEWR